jgi:hypothetical protein
MGAEVVEEIDMEALGRDDFDTIVVGSGPGGGTVAREAAAA